MNSFGNTQRDCQENTNSTSEEDNPATDGRTDAAVYAQKSLMIKKKQVNDVRKTLSK